MQKWHEISAESVNRQSRLCPIGQTRWWAKDAALRKVFGCFGKPESAMFIDLILTLAAIVEDKTMQSTARVKATGFMEGLLKYKTILTAQTFLHVFEHTGPLSKYLQTSGMDLLTAQRLVVGTADGLKKCEGFQWGPKSCEPICGVGL